MRQFAKRRGRMVALIAIVGANLVFAASAIRDARAQEDDLVCLDIERCKCNGTGGGAQCSRINTGVGDQCDAQSDCD